MFFSATQNFLVEASGINKLFLLKQEIEFIYQTVIETHISGTDLYVRLTSLYIAPENTVYQITPHHSNEIILCFSSLKRGIIKADDEGYLLLSPAGFNFLLFNFVYKNIAPSIYRIPEIPMMSNIICHRPHQLFLLGSQHIYRGSPFEEDDIFRKYGLVFQLVTEEDLSSENQKLYYRLSHLYKWEDGSFQKFEAIISNQVIRALPALYLRSLILDKEGFILLNLDDQFTSDLENYPKLDLDGDYEYDLFLSARLFLDSEINYPTVDESIVDFILSRKSALFTSRTRRDSPFSHVSERLPFFQAISSLPETEIEPSNKNSC